MRNDESVPCELVDSHAVLQSPGTIAFIGHVVEAGSAMGIHTEQAILGEEINDMKGEQIMAWKSSKITEGLGFGTGPISADTLRTNIGQEMLDRTDEVLSSTLILVAVDRDENGELLDDDGCGDGRLTKRVFDRFKEYRRSLNRYKVFGGGATMVAAARVGSGEAQGGNAEQNFSDSIVMCGKKGINFGAHTDEHAEGGNCGCGAIDKNPLIIAASKEYREQIVRSFNVLGVDTEGLDQIMDNYAAYADEIAGDSSFMGSNIMKKIIYFGKIVKQLGGQHVESRIVLNFVPGHTVNQNAVRQATDGKADVFAVDVPRLQEIAYKLNPDPEKATTRDRDFKSMLVYTLATAAVLTPGDLPVWAIKPVTADQHHLTAV